MYRVNTSKIKGKMGEKGYNMTTLSKELSIDRNTLRNYFRNPGKMTYETMSNMAMILFDSPEETCQIFFAQ